MSCSPLAILYLALFVCGAHAAIQIPSPVAPAESTPTTLRADARLVLVDVVVTDKHQRAVHGLTAGDFHLTDEGVPQNLKSFEEHVAGPPAPAVRSAAVKERLPGVFTNRMAVPANTTTNILLLDTLNTPLKDQSFVRAQLLQYLKSAQPAANVAIFGLTSRLVMLQGFTSDPELLKAAVEHRPGKSSPLLNDAIGGGGIQNSLSDDMEDAGNVPQQVINGMREFEAEQKSFQLQLRAKYTLDALSLLARYLAAVPGRKNLIWFSGSFPVTILPDPNVTSNPFVGVASAGDEFDATVRLLAASQVAVYPVDARGLMTQPTFDATSTRRYSGNPGRFKQDLEQFSSDTASEHATMLQMANDTGGKAFVNTNGLTQAVAAAIDLGSNFYTLSYTPSAEGRKEAFRRIQVKLDREGYTLSYRRGYYAMDRAVSGNDGAALADIRAAFARGAPNATQIVFDARLVSRSTGDETKVVDGNLVPPHESHATGPYRSYSVLFAVGPAGVTFKDLPDGQHQAALDFVTLVYDSEGRPLNSQSNSVAASLTTPRYIALQHDTLKYEQRISVPVRGSYFLRLVVRDRLGDHLGSLEVVGGITKGGPAVVAAQ